MPRKKEQVSAQDIVTALLKAEVEAKEKKEAADKPDKARTRKPRARKKASEVKPKRITKAVQKHRDEDYRLIERAWKDPASANLRPDGVTGYIKGIVQVERKSSDPDLEHIQDLLFLAALWQVKTVEV